MTAIRTPYFRDVPTVTVAFWEAKSVQPVTRRLMIDSGFTGLSSFVLSADDCVRFKRWPAEPGRIRGAITGIHNRCWVKCSISELNFNGLLVSVASDFSTLPLPKGVDGLAGLSFLSRFIRWGGEQDASGNWSFLLER